MWCHPSRSEQPACAPVAKSRQNVSASIGQGIELIAVPNQGDWTISAYQANDKSRTDDLLFPSAEWHGPYPADVEAWQVLKHYGFGSTRWVCVRGYPLEVKLQLRDARVKPVSGGDIAVFTAGRLVVQWFHRPCTDDPYYK